MLLIPRMKGSVSSGLCRDSYVLQTCALPSISFSRRLLPIYSSDDSSSQTFSIWPRYLVVIMTVIMRPVFAIPLSILITIFVAPVIMIFLPFHFPLPVFELPDRYPSLRQARRRLQVRQVRIR